MGTEGQADSPTDALVVAPSDCVKMRNLLNAGSWRGALSAALCRHETPRFEGNDVPRPHQVCVQLRSGELASLGNDPRVGLVAVLFGFIRPHPLDTDIARLILGEFRKFGAKFLQLQTRDFFVEVFG
jgi:hypothetical protein